MLVTFLGNSLYPTIIVPSEGFQPTLGEEYLTSTSPLSTQPLAISSSFVRIFLRLIKEPQRFCKAPGHIIVLILEFLYQIEDDPNVLHDERIITMPLVIAKDVCPAHRIAFLSLVCFVRKLLSRPHLCFPFNTHFFVIHLRMGAGSNRRLWLLPLYQLSYPSKNRCGVPRPSTWPSVVTGSINLDPHRKKKGDALFSRFIPPLAASLSHIVSQYQLSIAHSRSLIPQKPCSGILGIFHSSFREMTMQKSKLLRQEGVLRFWRCLFLLPHPCWLHFVHWQYLEVRVLWVTVARYLVLALPTLVALSFGLTTFLFFGREPDKDLPLVSWRHKNMPVLRIWRLREQAGIGSRLWPYYLGMSWSLRSPLQIYRIFSNLIHLE